MQLIKSAPQQRPVFQVVYKVAPDRVQNMFFQLAVKMMPAGMGQAQADEQLYMMLRQLIGKVQ